MVKVKSPQGECGLRRGPNYDQTSTVFVSPWLDRRCARHEMPASPDPDFHIVDVEGRPFWLPVVSGYTPKQRAKPVVDLRGTEELRRASATPDLCGAEELRGDADGPCHTGALREESWVANSLVGALIGRNGETRERLQRETGASLEIAPRSDGKGKGGGGKGGGRSGGGRGRPGDRVDETLVTMSASTADALESLVTRVSIVLADARQRVRPTHFVSIPLTQSGVQRKVGQFFAEVRKYFVEHLAGESHARGLTSEMLAEPNKFHVTLLMLRLLTAREIEAAVTALRAATPTLRDAVGGARAASLRLSGLEYMNDDPSECDVLYAKIQVGRVERPEVG